MLHASILSLLFSVAPQYEPWPMVIKCGDIIAVRAHAKDIWIGKVIQTLKQSFEIEWFEKDAKKNYTITNKWDKVKAKDIVARIMDWEGGEFDKEVFAEILSIV